MKFCDWPQKAKSHSCLRLGVWGAAVLRPYTVGSSFPIASGAKAPTLSYLNVGAKAPTHKPLRIRGVALEDEFFHGVGEAFVFAARGDVGGGFLDFFAGLAHGDADAALFEHEDVVGLVADGGDFVGGNLQQVRHDFYDFAFVGFRMRHVEIVRL